VIKIDKYYFFSTDILMKGTLVTIVFSYLKKRRKHHQCNMFYILSFLYFFPTVHAEDLKYAELDFEIGEVSAYIRQISISQVPTNKSDMHIEQYGSNNQIKLDSASFVNTVEIYQQGQNNIANLNLYGNENNIFVLQLGEGNLVDMHQHSDSAVTSIEQIGNYNQVIMDLEGNSQVNRISQNGDHMKVSIRNQY